jgi:hypothetical protein
MIVESGDTAVDHKLSKTSNYIDIEMSKICHKLLKKLIQTNNMFIP